MMGLCPECDGAGKVETRVRTPLVSGTHRSAVHDLPCPECEGHGVETVESQDRKAAKLARRPSGPPEPTPAYLYEHTVVPKNQRRGGRDR